MPEKSSTTNSFIATKSILYSIIFHILIFKMVIFTIVPDNIPERPLLVFLGSILQYEDLVINLKPEKTDTGHLKALNVTAPILEIKEDSRRTLTNEKPSYTSSVPPNSKILVKSTFYTDWKRNPPEVRPSRILGIELEAPQHVPLKLPKND